MCIFTFREEANNYVEFQFLQAKLASFVALAVFFGSGLLPDPDGPFKPGRPNCHAWLVAIAFEISLAIIDNIKAANPSQLWIIASILGGLRILILLLMTAVFVYHEQRKLWKEFGTDEERESFASNRDGNSPNYGAAKPPDIQGQARDGGWLAYFDGFRRLFPYIWPSNSREQQLITVFCFVLLILQRIVNVMVPLQLGILFDALGVGSVPYNQIAFYCLYRGLQGQQGVIGSLRAVLWIPISQSLYRRLTYATYSHVLLLSLDFHLSKRIGEVMNALGKGGALNTFLDAFAFQLFPMVFDLAIAAVWLFINFDAFYSIIVVTVMWNYIFATIYMAKYRAKARREMATRERNMEAAKTDAIMAYETVHYNGAFRVETSKFHKLVTAFQASEFSVLCSLNYLNAAQNSIFIIGVITVCILSAYQISIGIHTASDFVTLITYFAQLQAPLAFFGSFYNQVQNNLVDAERMLELFNSKPDIEDDPDAKTIPSINGHLTVNNVAFSYGNGRRSLNHISFSMAPGTSTAIVGESGSGKSTILKLLFRFYNPDEGQICIDNIDTRKITIDSLRDKIGVVPQDTVLFNESVMYNLLYARPDASEAEVFEACRAASIHEKILGFPEGYRTIVGERGLKLSGGEKQRVAIARAILKKAQVMLLDEATASLDTHTEKLIQGSLENVTRGRTTITVAHRLSTITQSDQILVLHMGRIVERGTHAELLALGGRYLDMWEKQTETEKAKDE
ncbi:putative ABC heavy metal transporter [Bisporella sp. PMI_857]|nr:putative ABC heavy metal transporter [Bisporella sp. PMI_857]